MGYELSQDEGRIVDAIAALEASGRPVLRDRPEGLTVFGA
jgi:hypothetical protein